MRGNASAMGQFGHDQADVAWTPPVAPGSWPLIGG
jgi:hypothetical protein